MPKKRALENPVEIRNEIDGEWMVYHFHVKGDWYWIPEQLKEMTQTLSRESILSDEDVERLKETSVYCINFLSGELYNTKTRNKLAWHTNIYASNKMSMNGEYSGFQRHIIVCLIKYGLRPTSTHSVDHIDRDEANDKPNNLRYATNSEQNINRDFNPRPKPMIEIDEFIESNYIEVKYCFTKEGGIIPFIPTWKKASIHLCLNGKHVIINRKFIISMYLTTGYPCISIREIRQFLHRLIYINYYETNQIRVIDHIDNDPLNWAIDNLRECSSSENSKYAAREQNAHKNKHAVTIRDIMTGELHDFASKRHCAEFLKLTVYYTRLFLKSKYKLDNYEAVKVLEHDRPVKSRRAVICNGQHFDSTLECANYLHTNHLQHLKLGSVIVGVRKRCGKKKLYHGFTIEYDTTFSLK